MGRSTWHMILPVCVWLQNFTALVLAVLLIAGQTAEATTQTQTRRHLAEQGAFARRQLLVRFWFLVVCILLVP